MLLNPPPSVTCAANSSSVLCGWWREPPGLRGREQLEYHPGIGDTGGVSRDTGSVSEILGRYPRYCGGIVGGPLSHGYSTGSRTAGTRGNPRAQHRRRRSTTATPTWPTRCSVPHCSAPRVLRALPGPRVLRSGEQQCAMNGGGESRQVPLGGCPDLRENGAFSGTDCADLLRGRMRRSPGECPARSPGKWGVLRPRWAAWARSPRFSVRCVGGVHMVGAAAAIACALGRILPWAGRGWEGFFPGGAWLGRILPRRGDWGNDWEMDVSSVGKYFVPNVELRYNKKNTRYGTRVRV